MKRLDEPKISAEKVLNCCIDNIRRKKDLKTRIEEAKAELLQLALKYKDDAVSGKLFTHTALPKKAPDNTLSTTTITKGEFINLYEYYLLSDKKPGRAIYDELLAAANDKCPYCCEIGQPRNLDHFMPKGFFPQFAVLPSNLVPACRDCNMDGKGDEYANTEEEQLIHPYFDKDCFFNEQWLRAQIIPGSPIALIFFVDAPTNWSSIDKRRVENNFKNLNLAKRYSIQAANELETVIGLRKNYLSKMSPNEFKGHLVATYELPHHALNHWKKVMYQCLKNDDEFCKTIF